MLFPFNFFVSDSPSKVVDTTVPGFSIPSSFVAVSETFASVHHILSYLTSVVNIPNTSLWINPSTLPGSFQVDAFPLDNLKTVKIKQVHSMSELLVYLSSIHLLPVNSLPHVIVVDGISSFYRSSCFKIENIVRLIAVAQDAANFLVSQLEPLGVSFLMVFILPNNLLGHSFLSRLFSTRITQSDGIVEVHHGSEKFVLT
ncbi:hypothetical protein RCL1_001002 [Eukaryota sp. TZLM3-RCL]